MRILVTGGSGFVGRNLTEQLVRDGHEVTITSTGSEPIIAGAKKILYMGLEGIDWKHVYGQDAVVHLMANNDTLCRDRDEVFRANVFGPIKLFVAAMQGGCKNFIYASSTAVYGSQPAPFVEGITEVKPLNVYGESKAKFDEFAMSFAEEHKVNVSGFRYCNIYGPGEEQKGRRMSMIGQLLKKMLKGEQPVLFEFGDQRRDWVFVKDVVQANVKALAREVSEPRGAIYNIGSGTSHTYNEIISIINEVAGLNLQPRYIPCPFPESFQNFTECDITKAKKELGYDPEFSLRSGIETYFRSLTSCPS